MSVPVILDNIISKNNYGTKNMAKLLEKSVNKNLYYPQYSILETNFDHASEIMVKNFIHDLYLYQLRLQGVAYVENMPLAGETKIKFLEILKTYDAEATCKPSSIVKCTINGKVALAQDYVIHSKKFSGNYFASDLMLEDDVFSQVKVHSLQNILLPQKRKFFVLKDAELINYVLTFFLKIIVILILIMYIVSYLCYKIYN